MPADRLAPEYRAFLRRREWQRRLKGLVRGESPGLALAVLLIFAILGAWIDDRTTRFMATRGFHGGGVPSAIIAVAFATCIVIALSSIGSWCLAKIIANRALFARLALLLLAFIMGLTAVGTLLMSFSSFPLDRRDEWLQLGMGAGLAIAAGVAFGGLRYLYLKDNE